MKTNRYLIAALLVSVAINLVIIGVFAGRAFKPGQQMTRLDPMVSMRRLLKDLPDDRAQDLAPYYRAYFSALRPRLGEIRAAQQSLRDAMLAEPVAEQALEEALININNQVFATQGSAHRALVALASALTLTERQQLMALLAEPTRRGRPPHRAGDRRHPPEQSPHQSEEIPQR